MNDMHAEVLQMHKLKVAINLARRMFGGQTKTGHDRIASGF